MGLLNRSVVSQVAVTGAALAIALGLASALAPRTDVSEPASIARVASSATPQDAAARATLPEPSLRLLFTGSLEGFLEPCGCTAGRLGGLDRVATQLVERGSKGPSAVYIDCGDTFVASDDVSPTLSVQLPIKADAMLSILASAGCEAMALGDYDLVLGVRALRELSERHGVPILCANLVDANGARVFKAVEIVERQGLRIGIFSLLAQNLVHPDPTDSSVLKVGQTIEELGLRLQPWRNVARELVASLKDKVDVIVCASHLGAEANLELCELCPQIDIICGPHWDGLGAFHVVKGTSLVSLLYLKGSRVTQFDRWWGSAAPTTTDHGELGEDITGRVEAVVQRAVTVAGLRNLLGRQAVLGFDEFEQRRMSYEAFIAQSDAFLAMAGDFPTGRAFSVTQQTIHRNLERQESVLARLDEYHSRLEAFWDGRAANSKPSDSPFVDPQRCATCHVDQYEFWKSTRHSRAYSTLAITDQQYDAECFYCHTVGFDQPGGFKHPREAGGFENVQCAACHGAGAGHLLGGLDYLGGRHLIKVGSTCTQCHDSTHDPEFASLVKELPRTTAQVQEKLSRVACPKMPGPGQGTPAFLAALAEAGDALRALPEIDWSEVVRVYSRAGESEAALAAAERYVAASKESYVALRTLGLLLCADGRLDEGAQNLVRALPGLSGDLEVELALARALLVSDRAQSLFHAREALSLAPQFVDAALAMARALAANDDRDGARRFIEGQLAQYPDQREVLQELLDELR